MGDTIRMILVENAKRCKIKTRKIRKDNPQCAPWFDGECENNKNNVRKFGNDLRKSPHDLEIRQSLQEAKKKLKQIVTGREL